MSRLLAAVILLTMAGIVPCAATDPAPPGPRDVVQALYGACLAHSDGFDQKSVDLAKPYITHDLYKRIEKKLNQPVPKGDAPDIEGDLFLDCQDMPDSVSIRGSTVTSPGNASVNVSAKWSSETRTYTVSLVQDKSGRWKVSDVNYGKDGKLSDLLK